MINLTNVHFNWHQVWNDCKSKATVAEATLKTQPLRLCSTLATGDFQIIEMMWHIYENRLFFTLNRAMPKENMVSLHYLLIYRKVWKLAERSAFFCNWWWFSSAAGETHKKTYKRKFWTSNWRSKRPTKRMLMWLSLLDIIFCVMIFFCRTSSSCLQTVAATWARSGKAELASLRTRCQGKNKILQQFSKYLPVWAVTSDKVLGGSKQWNSDPERFVDVRSQVLLLL